MVIASQNGLIECLDLDPNFLPAPVLSGPGPENDLATGAADDPGEEGEEIFISSFFCERDRTQSRHLADYYFFSFFFLLVSR